MNDKLHVIQAINFIEQNINNKIAIKDIAYTCNISTMQLHRDFYDITGYSTNEYIRKRRISNALAQIKMSEYSLADIAYSCGYSSQQSLCREIKSLIGVTATDYKNNNEYFFFPPCYIASEYQISVMKCKIPSTLCIKYYSTKYVCIENKAVNCFINNNPGYTGKIFGRNGRQRSNEFCYELYIEQKQDFRLNINGFESGSIFPSYSTTCAIVSVNNHDLEINAGWNYIYNNWLTSSIFEYVGIDNDTYESQYFEEYLYKNNRIYRLKLHIPIKKRSEYDKIRLENLGEMKFLVSTEKGFNAEKKASENIVSYLLKYYPYLIAISRIFYIKKEANICTSGIIIDNNIKIKNSGMQILSIKASRYAVLYCNGVGDFEKNKQTLFSWMNENNIKASDEAFSLYYTNDGYEKVKMKLFYPICL